MVVGTGAAARAAAHGGRLGQGGAGATATAVGRGRGGSRAPSGETLPRLRLGQWGGSGGREVEEEKERG